MAKLALPAGPTAPISRSDQRDGSAVATVNEMEAVLTRLPTVPVIVTANVPMAAVLLAVNVRVLVPALLVGLKEAVTPAGRPDADKFTLEVKPF